MSSGCHGKNRSLTKESKIVTKIKRRTYHEKRNLVAQKDLVDLFSVSFVFKHSLQFAYLYSV